MMSPIFWRLCRNGIPRRATKALSSNQFRRLCRTDYLNYLRVREWQDIYTQLRQVVKNWDSGKQRTRRIPEIHVALCWAVVAYRDERCR